MGFVFSDESPLPFLKKKASRIQCSAKMCNAVSSVLKLYYSRYRVHRILSDPEDQEIEVKGGGTLKVSSPDTSDCSLLIKCY